MTGPRIVSRAEWGARPWRTQPGVARPGVRRAFMVHYHGGTPRHDRGPDMAREVEGIHYDRGWAGVGYSWMVGQDGVAYEGRGLAHEAAACPGWNLAAYHAYVAVGPGQAPSGPALRTVRGLYGLACGAAGRELERTWHRAKYATECPGPQLIHWVRRGMPVPDAEPEGGGAMTPEEIELLVQRVARVTADMVTGIGARHPVRVPDGIGAGRLPDGGSIDAIPTVLGRVDQGLREALEILRRLDPGLGDR